jgi:hypothetical protein
MYKAAFILTVLPLILSSPVPAQDSPSAKPDTPPPAAIAGSNAPLLVLEEGKDAVRCPVPGHQILRSAHRDKSLHVFPEWVPPPPPAAALDWRPELRDLLAQGRRDRAASPEFLDALQRLLDRHAANPAPVPPPSDRLPFRPAFDAPGMPPGWSAVRPDVWRFGGGFATQIRSWADTRFVLSYDPGRDWRDYSATFTVESDSWFTHPMRSSAVLYFRYRGVADSFALWLDSAGDLTLSSHEPGGSRILARIPVEPAVIRDGRPWTVTVRGDEIKVFHEGRCLLMASDPAHPRGTVGLEAVHIPARFSSLSVTAPAR